MPGLKIKIEYHKETESLIVILYKDGQTFDHDAWALKDDEKNLKKFSEMVEHSVNLLLMEAQ